MKGQALAAEIGVQNPLQFGNINALWSTLAFALDAIAIAGQAIVGRYLGAADVARARAATRRMIEWGVAAGAVFGVVMVLARPLYVSLFTRDLDVQALLASVVLLFLVFEPVAGVVFVLDGVLIGAGDGRYLAYAGVWTLVASPTRSKFR